MNDFRLRYRSDIDGMRALAVVPVCVFHLALPGCPGGFVGVDVFFVISGFLMATLIGGELRSGGFSFAGFYERRARRLLPALFAMLLFVAVTAAWLVTPRLFRDVGAMIAAAALFSANIVLWRMSANYFNPATDWNPLVHTWSLGVEEQFYILFPVFLVAVWKTRPATRLSLVLIVATLSLLLSLWGTYNAPTATFYLLPMRAWELLLGSAVALADLHAFNRPARMVAAGVGVTLVLISVFFFDNEIPFPGAAALVPCGGAALMLAFGGEPSPVNAALSLTPLRFIGKISYSLYLWHWPLLVFATRYTSYAASPGLGTKLLLLAASIALAYVSWRWIEQPFRRGQHSAMPTLSRRSVVGGTAFATAMLLAFGSFAIASDGWPGRLRGYTAISMEQQRSLESADIPRETYEQQHHSQCFSVSAADWRAEPCYLTRGGTVNVLLWGDSFAAAYAAGFFDHPGLRWNVLQYTSPACPPVVGYSAASRPECAKFDARIAEIVRSNKIAAVVMAANWSAYLQRRKLVIEDIGRTAAYLKSLQVKVILVGQSPVFGFPYPDVYYYRTYGASRAAGDYFAPSEAGPELSRQILASAGSNTEAFFDPSALFCRRRECVFRRDNQYLFEDFGHFSRYGSSIAVVALLRTLSATDPPGT